MLADVSWRLFVLEKDYMKRSTLEMMVLASGIGLLPTSILWWLLMGLDSSYVSPIKDLGMVIYSIMLVVGVMAAARLWIIWRQDRHKS
ncbi:MAG: hypothetical protein QOH93_3134 [Chloroflexia bacterium]|jgi:hypothetical protein|nr:hypothetical protein [Chloroflexia bacterium]